MLNEFMVRLCGMEWLYCNGDCKNCNKPEYYATNKLTEVKENKDAE